MPRAQLTYRQALYVNTPSLLSKYPCQVYFLLVNANSTDAVVILLPYVRACLAFVAVLSVGHPWACVSPVTYYLIIIAARKPSSSSNTTIPLNKNVEEGTSPKAMTNDAPAVNGSQDHDNNNDGDKPAVIAKEPMASKPMVYEPLPVKKRNGLTNGNTNHTSHDVAQRQPSLYPNLLPSR